MAKRIGNNTLNFEHRPYILGYGSVVGKKEHDGPLGDEFDSFSEDSRFGEKTFEKAESRLQSLAVGKAAERAGIRIKELDMIFAGDLLNQCIVSSFGLRDLGIPFIGIYGACSTMALGSALACLSLESGGALLAAAVTSSHFCSAERQYRFPLEYGYQRTPTAQWTVTGAGALIFGKNNGTGIYADKICFGKIVDLGVTDANNMGAAMAPDDVKIRPYPKSEGMVFFYTQIQYLRGLGHFLRIFKAQNSVKNSGLESRYIYPNLSTKRRKLFC